jgi:asparagine synthase (glutamine-hydrolysing)
MCGIAGIIDLQGSAVAPGAVERLTALIAHRGPGGAGFWFSEDKHIALGLRRLAIIDPGARGNQPMASGDGRHVIVYNGEVYNFLELREELEALGIAFRTESDTEVILAAWQTWGLDMLLRFNGMWAFAVVDNASGDVFLARDRFGIKPLLYSFSDGRLVFASEMRALIGCGLVATDLNIEVARRILVDAFNIEEASARCIGKSGGCREDIVLDQVRSYQRDALVADGRSSAGTALHPRRPGRSFRRNFSRCGKPAYAQ